MNAHSFGGHYYQGLLRPLKLLFKIIDTWSCWTSAKKTLPTPPQDTVKRATATGWLHQTLGPQAQTSKLGQTSFLLLPMAEVNF